jgi:hypothetical protein
LCTKVLGNHPERLRKKPPGQNAGHAARSMFRDGFGPSSDIPESGGRTMADTKRARILIADDSETNILVLR